MTRFLATTLAAVLVYAAFASIALAQGATGLVLDAVGGSAARGTAAISTVPGRAPAVQLTLELSGLTPRTRYTVHLHAGTYDAPAASFGTLGQVEADAGGRGRLQTAEVRFGAAGATAELTEALLLDGDHFLDLHDPAGQVARGRLPRQTTTPTQLPRTGAPLVPIVAVGLAALAAAAWLRLRWR